MRHAKRVIPRPLASVRGRREPKCRVSEGSSSDPSRKMAPGDTRTVARLPPFSVRRASVRHHARHPPISLKFRTSAFPTQSPLPPTTLARRGISYLTPSFGAATRMGPCSDRVMCFRSSSVPRRDLPDSPQPPDFSSPLIPAARAVAAPPWREKPRPASIADPHV